MNNSSNGSQLIMLSQSNFDFTLQTDQWRNLIQKLYLPFEGDITQKFNTFFVQIYYPIINGSNSIIVNNLFFLSSKKVFRLSTNKLTLDSNETYSNTISEYNYSYYKEENYFSIEVWTSELSQFHDGNPYYFGYYNRGNINFIVCA